MSLFLFSYFFFHLRSRTRASSFFNCYPLQQHFFCFWKQNCWRMLSHGMQCTWFYHFFYKEKKFQKTITEHPSINMPPCFSQSFLSDRPVWILQGLLCLFLFSPCEEERKRKTKAKCVFYWCHYQGDSWSMSARQGENKNCARECANLISPSGNIMLVSPQFDFVWRLYFYADAHQYNLLIFMRRIASRI